MLSKGMVSDDLNYKVNVSRKKGQLQQLNMPV